MEGDNTSNAKDTTDTSRIWNPGELPSDTEHVPDETPASDVKLPYEITVDADTVEPVPGSKPDDDETDETDDTEDETDKTDEEK